MLQCYNATIATMLQCRIQCVSASYLSSLGSQCPAAPRPGAAPTTAQPHHPSWKICTLPSLSSAPSHIWTISWKALFLNSIYFTDEHFPLFETFSNHYGPYLTIFTHFHTLTFSHLHTFKFSDSHAFTLSDFHSFTLSDSQIKTTEFPVTHIVEGFRHYHFCSYFVKILMQLFCQNFNAAILSFIFHNIIIYIS